MLCNGGWEDGRVGGCQIPGKEKSFTNVYGSTLLEVRKKLSITHQWPLSGHSSVT